MIEYKNFIFSHLVGRTILIPLIANRTFSGNWDYYWELRCFGCGHAIKKPTDICAGVITLRDVLNMFEIETPVSCKNSVNFININFHLMIYCLIYIY